MDEIFGRARWCPICKVGQRVNAVGRYLGLKYFYLACGHHTDEFGDVVCVREEFGADTSPAQDRFRAELGLTTPQPDVTPAPYCGTGPRRVS